MQPSKTWKIFESNLTDTFNCHPSEYFLLTPFNCIINSKHVKLKGYASKASRRNIMELVKF